MIHAVYVCNHVSKEFTHCSLGVFVIAQVLHLSLECEIEGFRRRLIEANSSEYVPVSALVGAILLIARKQKVIECERAR